MPGFYVSAEDLNSGLHPCSANIHPLGYLPSPYLVCLFVFSTLFSETRSLVCNSLSKSGKLAWVLQGSAFYLLSAGTTTAGTVVLCVALAILEHTL